MFENGKDDRFAEMACRDPYFIKRRAWVTGPRRVGPKGKHHRCRGGTFVRELKEVLQRFFAIVDR